jgi:flagellar biosynthetic protein FliP
LEFFLELGRFPPTAVKDIPLRVVIPSFVISELQTAFQMGFLLFLPFLVIDFLVSAVLMALGMMMMPPSVVSLPFKLLLFVLVDGWHLVVRSLVQSFQT